MAVPNAIWEHRGRWAATPGCRSGCTPTTASRSSAGARRSAARPVAGLHHDRLDGSGYHRGATAVQLWITARVLAAADVRQALVSDRPHRPAHPPIGRHRCFGRRRTRGRLDNDAVGRSSPAAAAVHRRDGSTGRVDRSAGRGAPAGGPRDVEPGDRRRAGDLGANRRTPRPGRLRADRSVQSGRGRDVRDGARPAVGHEHW